MVSTIEIGLFNQYDNDKGQGYRLNGATSELLVEQGPLS